MVTAFALSSPATTAQTSRDCWITGRVREIRVGGGLGAPLTATTVPVVVERGHARGRATRRGRPARRRAGRRRSRRVGMVLRSGGRGQLVAWRAGGRLRVVAVGAVRRRHRVHPCGVERDRVEQRIAGEVSLRSGSPAGRNRSSPHHTSRRRQSIAPRAGESRSASSVRRAMLPPVSTSDASPRADCTSTRRVMRRAATAAASSSGSRWTSTVGVLTTSAFVCACRSWLRRPLRGRLRRGLGGGLRGGGGALLRGGLLGSRLGRLRLGRRRRTPRRRPHRVAPDVLPLRRSLVELLLAGHCRQCVGVGLVGVQPAQLLGQQVAQRAALQGSSRSDMPVRERVAR